VFSNNYNGPFSYNRQISQKKWQIFYQKRQISPKSGKLLATLNLHRITGTPFYLINIGDLSYLPLFFGKK
jgi:hypothetical protein